MATQRSDAARSASRRNGALSRGPKTAAGKAGSAHNAVKHGLRSALPREIEHLPAWLCVLENELSALADRLDPPVARELLDRALTASLRLRQAEEMVGELMAELLNPNIVGSTTVNSITVRTKAELQALAYEHVFGEKTDLSWIMKPKGQPQRTPVTDWRRLMVLLRYEARFRGQRDRALRKLLQRR